MIDFERSGSGAAVVLVHGITESKRTWDPLIERLAGSYDVVALDLRGHGQSLTQAPYDVLTMASDVDDVVQSLQLREPLLIGHSLGGTVVSAYAAMFPCRGVVNIDQSMRLGSFRESLRSVEPLLRGDEASFRGVIDALFESMRGELGDQEWSRVQALRHPDQEVVLGVWSAVFDTDPDELDAMVSALASAISVPYLSLHGTDPGDGYEEWLGGLVDEAHVERWPLLGHYPHLVAPDRFMKSLEDFEATLSR